MCKDELTENTESLRKIIVEKERLFEEKLVTLIASIIVDKIFEDNVSEKSNHIHKDIQ